MIDEEQWLIMDGDVKELSHEKAFLKRTWTRQEKRGRTVFLLLVHLFRQW